MSLNIGISFTKYKTQAALSLQLKLLNMKKFVIPYLIFFLALMHTTPVHAQCSICTATASQLGEKQGNGLNAGIIYLMLTPFAVGGFIGFRWWQREKELRKTDDA